MRGHDAIIQSRMKGIRPNPVKMFFGLDEVRDVCINGVFIDTTDSLASLDLRFLVDLPVFVMGTVKTKVQAITRLCVEAKAQTVIAAVFERRPYGYDTHSYFDSTGSADAESCMESMEKLFEVVSRFDKASGRHSKPI